MEKACRKCAPKASPRPFLNFAIYAKATIACKKFLQIDILKEDYQKA